MPESCAIVEKPGRAVRHVTSHARGANSNRGLHGIGGLWGLMKHPLNTRVNPTTCERRKADMIAYVDGGSRGNPGPAGIGVVIQHPTGRRVEISQHIGAGDNNYAEYAALLVALEYASTYEFPRLEVFSDSEVVVRQISGAYSCQSASLRDIHSECKNIIAKFQDFTITHIRRENNSHADRLAKQAIERACRERQPAAGHHSHLLDATVARVLQRLAKGSALFPIEQTG